MRFFSIYFQSYSVLAKGLNDGGRGFNIVVVDPITKDVVRVGHFDTYAEGKKKYILYTLY